MKRIVKDDTVSLKNKEQLLRELKQDELIELFKGAYKNPYKPATPKQVCLDQQIAMSISEQEKDFIRKDLEDIRRVSSVPSISAYIRNKVTNDVDIVLWREKALDGLRRLSSKDYDEKELNMQRKQYLKYIDELSDVTAEDDENEFDDSEERKNVYLMKLKKVEERLKELKANSPKRGYRLAGRVTFNEANIIRWRAARLSLTIADFIRFVLFGYNPNSVADSHLSVVARKRFYVSVLDVAKNGWGHPPTIDECPNCARYKKDIETMKEQLIRYQTLERTRRI